MTRLLSLGRWRHAGLTALTVVITVCPGYSQELPAQRGLKALRAGRYEEAAALLNQARQETGPEAAEARRLAFDQGVALQRLAEDVADPERPQLLEQAVRAYQDYLKFDPRSAAAANNCARALEASGRPAEARSYYQMAIRTDDPRRGIYLENFARFLDSVGDHSEASALYLRLIVEEPGAVSRHEVLTRRFASLGDAELAAYLWRVLDRGWVEQAAETALGRIEASRNERDPMRVELLGLVCKALSLAANEPAAFEIRLLTQLEALANDEFVGVGAATIRAAYQRPPAPHGSDWWTQWTDLEHDPPRGVWPLEGFRTLLRSLASRSLEANDKVGAERYLRAAAELIPWEVDVEAVRQLVRLKLRSGDLSGVDAIVSSYEAALFSGKAMAYRASRYAKIYDYHRTLGELYAFVNRWGDSTTTHSAIYQLEHARRIAQRIGPDTSVADQPEVRFGGEMTELLASGYRATGRVTESQVLLVEEAERFQKLGHPTTTQRILSGIDPEALPTTLQVRYQKLAGPAAVVVTSPTNQIARNPEPVTQPFTTEQLATIAERLRSCFSRPSCTAANQVDWSGLPGRLVSFTAPGEGSGTLLVELEAGGQARLDYRVRKTRQGIRIEVTPRE